MGNRKLIAIEGGRNGDDLKRLEVTSIVTVIQGRCI